MTNSTQSRDFYDKEALVTARYSTERFWENRYHNKRRVIVQTILKNSLSGCETFLDIGCGTGEYLSFAQQRVIGVRGLDVSKCYLHRCKLSKANDLILGDCRNLPFKDGAFDSVLCSEVIEHIQPFETAIRELLRISRKTLVVSTLNHGILRMLLARLRKRKLASIDAEVGHINILRFPELLSKFNNHGWKTSVALTVNIFPPFLDTIPFPRAMAPLMDFLEHIMDKLLPSMGSVTVINLESSSII
jgi:ubiquinone/menaquinone biosynthesis C-methylase UbiE